MWDSPNFRKQSPSHRHSSAGLVQPSPVMVGLWHWVAHTIRVIHFSAIIAGYIPTVNHC